MAIIERLKETHRAQRLRKEVLSIEEAVWLIIGLSVGYLVAKGISTLLLIVIAVIFIAFVYEEFYARKHGLFNVFGERVKK